MPNETEMKVREEQIEAARKMERKQRVFKTTAQRFGYMKEGCKYRFQHAYAKQKEEVQTAWLADLEAKEKEFQTTARSNQALAKTKLEHSRKQAEKLARKVMNMVFQEWREEMHRIVNKLDGWIQEDGLVIFPDKSSAKMPKGLYIPEDQQLRLE